MWSHIWLRAALALPFLKSISPEYFFSPRQPFLTCWFCCPSAVSGITHPWRRRRGRSSGPAILVRLLHPKVGLSPSAAFSEGVPTTGRTGLYTWGAHVLPVWILLWKFCVRTGRQTSASSPDTWLLRVGRKWSFSRCSAESTQKRFFNPLFFFFYRLCFLQ